MRQTRRTKEAERKYIRRHIIGDKHCYCTGCGRVFEYTDQLRDHRNTFRCGGMFKGEQDNDVLKFGFACRPRIIDPRSTGINLRRVEKTASGRVPYTHLARSPGTVRASNLPGGPACRNAALGMKKGKRYGVSHQTKKHDIAVIPQTILLNRR